MKQFVSFVKKEAWHIMRDKRTMLILFGMPVVLMLLFGYAISTEVRNVRVVAVTSQADSRTQAAVERLAVSEYFDITASVATPQAAEQLIRSQQADMAVVFGAGYASGRSGVQLMVDGSDPNMAQQWANYATNIIMDVYVNHGGQRQNHDMAMPMVWTGSAGKASGPHGVVNVRLLYNPQMKSAYNFVPAILGMLLMLVCAMMTSVSIVREKERGTMEVLLVSPVRPLLVVTAKLVPYLALAFLILTVILGIGHYVLGVPIEGSLLMIYAISTIYIMLALSLGLLISCVARTQLTALLICAMVLLMPIVMLSGMMFPVESMPRILQYVSALVPPRYYIQAMRKLMIIGTGAGEVLHETAVLCGMATLFASVALAKFKTRLE